MSGHEGKLVITHHADTLGRRHLRLLSDPFVRRVMARAEVITVESERYLNSSEELADFREKCCVIPPGIEVKQSDSETAATARDIRERYGSRIIVSVGRLVPYKGFEYLIQAMREIEATLLIIGSGPLRETLTVAIEKAGVGKKVHLLFDVDDVTPYYEASQMLVLPSISRAEGFGLVQVEAMAASLPVVNTNLDSGVPEVSVHEETGITVPPKDAAALAQAINYLLDNRDVRVRYGVAAKARAQREFAAGRMAERTLKLYQSVLGEGQLQFADLPA